MDNLRIEILTSGNSSVNRMQRELNDMCSKLGTTVSELEQVKRQIDTLPADLCAMRDASSKIGLRLAEERGRLERAENFRRQTDNFLRYTVETDVQVGQLLDCRRKSVERVAGRTVPKPVSERSTGERIADGWNKFWKDAGELWDKGVDKFKGAINILGEWGGKAADYIGKSLNNFLLGEFSGEDITILSLGGNIVASIFGVDLLCDIRDGGYHLTHWDELENPWGTLALDAVALVPVIGAVKYIKYSDEVIDGIKLTGDVADSVSDGAKIVDKAGDIADDVKTADKAVDASNTAGDVASEIAEKQRKADDRARTYNMQKKPVENARRKGYTDVIETPNHGISFSKSEHLYIIENGNPAIVRITPTGVRTKDYDAAIKKAQEELGMKEPPTGYTWHHVDDYDVESNTFTMELVKSDVHDVIRPHSGGCAQYSEVTGILYR